MEMKPAVWWKIDEILTFQRAGVPRVNKSNHMKSVRDPGQSQEEVISQDCASFASRQSLNLVPDKDTMGPIDDLDIAYDECIPWLSHHRHAYVTDENIVLDMNARGFQIGFVHREDGTDFLNTGYSNSDSRVESQDIHKRYDSTGDYSAPVKSSVATGKDDYVSSSTTVYDSSIKSDAASGGGIFSFMRSSSAPGNDANVQSNGTTGGGFFSYMKSSGAAGKDDNVQGNGTSGGGLFSFTKKSEASGKDDNVQSNGTTGGGFFSSMKSSGAAGKDDNVQGNGTSGGGLFSFTKNSDVSGKVDNVQSNGTTGGGLFSFTKKSEASGKDDNVQSNGASGGGFFSYMKSSDTSGKDDNMQSNGTSGGGFFSYMKSSGAAAKDENVQSNGTSVDGFFSYMKSSDASGKHNNVHESTSSSSIYSSPTKGQKTTGGGIFSYMSGYGTSEKGEVASGSDKSVTADSRRDYVLPAKSSVASGKDDDVVPGGGVFSYIRDTTTCEEIEITSRKLARKGSQDSCYSESGGSIFCESTEEQSVCSIP